MTLQPLCLPGTDAATCTVFPTLELQCDAQHVDPPSMSQSQDLRLVGCQHFETMMLSATTTLGIKDPMFQQPAHCLGNTHGIKAKLFLFVIQVG